MILSDRPRGAAPPARPRTGAPATAAPEPKASCPGCGRPVAMARLGKCLYCGGAVEAPADAAGTTATPAPPPAAPVPATPASALPPEVLFALEPRDATPNTRRLWALRIGAVAVVLLALLLMLAMSSGGPE